MPGIERFERKYLLTLGEYYRVRTRLGLHFEHDAYTRKEPSGRYLVRSIYYDTRDYRAYYEKEDGNFGRIKLRLRAYADVPGPDGIVSVELKTRNGNVMTKHTTRVPYGHYAEYEKTGHWPVDGDPVTAEFARLVRVRSLVPVVLVQYTREGYQARACRSVRLTIDHGVVSTRARSLFPDRAILRPHRPRHVILEIKTSGIEPRWLTKFVRANELKIMSNSKYVQGIEVIRPNMVTPREAAP